jgi:hypothetical protein
MVTVGVSQSAGEHRPIGGAAGESTEPSILRFEANRNSFVTGFAVDDGSGWWFPGVYDFHSPVTAGAADTDAMIQSRQSGRGWGHELSDQRYIEYRGNMSWADRVTNYGQGG